MSTHTNFRSGLWALALPILLSSLSSSIVNISIPTLISSFQHSLNIVQWVIVVYLISMMSSSVIIGQYLDRTDRRQILIYGIVLFMFSSVLCAIAPNILWLIICRVVQGIAAAMMLSSAMLLLNAYQSKSHSAKAMGWVGSLSATGTALGPTLGGSLISLGGWQAIFWVNIPIGIVALVLVWRLTQANTVQSSTAPSSPPKIANTADLAGMLLLTLSIISYALTLSLDRPFSLFFLVLTLLGLYCFYRVEQRAPKALIPLALLKNRQISTGLMMGSMMATAMMATLIVGPLYLSGVFHLNALHVGLVMSCGPIVAASFGVPAAAWVDRFGIKAVTRVALCCSVIGFSLFALLAQQLNVYGYLALMLLISFGYAIFQTANNTALMFALEPSRRGLMTGLINLSRQIGLINGAVLMSAIFLYAAEDLSVTGLINTDLNEMSVMHGFSICFAVTALFMAVALIMSFSIKVQAHSQKRPHH